MMVTLPSNASFELFKTNTVGCYTVDLAQAIQLSGDWVVVLCEIIYPRTWYNLNNYHAHFELVKTNYDDLQYQPQQQQQPPISHQSSLCCSSRLS